MLMSRFPLKGLVAAFLPISFLWLFVACVSTCTRESAEKQNRPIVSSSIETEDAPDCEGCLLTTFPQTTAPERVTFKLNLQASFAILTVTPSVNSSTDEITFQHRHFQSSSIEPPLKRLPTLRI
jgi:hypothetical protein